VIKPIKKLVWSLLNTIGAGGGIQLTLESGLQDDGWFRSYYTKESVNRAGEPIPWYTYAFIKFIDARVQPHFEVFEYGCGNSTLWYARYVKAVQAVEHDKTWYEKIKPKMPKNVTLCFQPLQSEEYVQTVHAARKKFHIIVIDGRRRSECLLTAVDALHEEGVLVMDNTERPHYQEAIANLEGKGFKRLDFWGIAPVAANNTCTSVFYKSGNCLGI